MKRDDEFEQRVAEWLQEGPDLAPTTSLDAALTKVRRVRPPLGRTARVWRWIGARWSGDSLEARPTKRGGQWLAAVASVALAITVLTAFAIVRIPPPSGSMLPGSFSPSVTPTRRVPPSPTPWPSLADLPVVLAPTLFETVCSDQNLGTSSYVGTTHVVTGIRIRCSDRTNDARMTGIGYRTYTNELDRDGTERDHGTGTMTNAGGSWTLVFTTLRRPGEAAGLNRSYWLGSGGYAGLQAREWLYMNLEGIVMAQPGILEVVGPLSSEGTASCRAGGTVPSLPATGAVTLVCAITAEDPRLSGMRTIALSLTARGDGTSAAAATIAIENDGGSWSGRAAGSLGRDGRLTLEETDLVGAGMYAGFRYAGSVSGSPVQLAITGTISPAR